jgi:hypothetical protein
MNIERTSPDYSARFGQPLASHPISSRKATSTDTLPVRSEVVARGRELASDDSYPPFAVCTKVAEKWLSIEGFDQ